MTGTWPEYMGVRHCQCTCARAPVQPPPTILHSLVLFENEDNVPVLSTQWNFGANGFLATFSHFSQCLIGGDIPDIYVA